MAAHETLEIGGRIERGAASGLLDLVKAAQPAWVTCASGKMMCPNTTPFAEITARLETFGLHRVQVTGKPDSDAMIKLFRAGLALGLSLRHAYRGGVITKPGIQLHEATTGEGECFLAVRGEPVLGAAEVEDPSRRAALARWAGWHPGPLIIADSHHAYLGVLARIERERRALAAV